MARTQQMTPYRRTSVALVAQLAEHILGKDEVTGSIPVKGFSLFI